MRTSARFTVLVSILVLSLVLWFTSSGFAHPPSAVNLSFDSETNILVVTALHSVGDPTDHYIEEVVVFLNGEETIVQQIFSQLDSGQQVVQYMVIDANPGDTIEVWAQCNRFGDLTGRLVVE